MATAAPFMCLVPSRRHFSQHHITTKNDMRNENGRSAIQLLIDFSRKKKREKKEDPNILM